MEQQDRFLDHARQVTRYGIYGDRFFLRTDEDQFLLFQAKEAA